ncbi:hypothetical protein C8Q75DRAFT_811267 [Abortiporus biennis]|nr:hypothetical protein C8Q75DRAFT_811267 [Abortiporus biennis]
MALIYNAGFLQVDALLVTQQFYALKELGIPNGRVVPSAWVGFKRRFHLELFIVDFGCIVMTIAAVTLYRHSDFHEVGTICFFIFTVAISMVGVLTSVWYHIILYKYETTEDAVFWVKGAEYLEECATPRFQAKDLFVVPISLFVWAAVFWISFIFLQVSDNHTDHQGHPEDSHKLSLLLSIWLIVMVFAIASFAITSIEFFRGIPNAVPRSPLRRISTAQV